MKEVKENTNFNYSSFKNCWKYYVSILFCLLLLFVEETSSAKFLSIAATATKSHQIVFEPLYVALAERGHELTIVSPAKLQSKGIKNIRHIQTYETDQLLKTAMPNLFEVKANMKPWQPFVANPFLTLFGWMESGCRATYEQTAIIDEIRRGKFDAIIFSPLFNDCLYGLIHEMNVTTILISPITAMSWLANTFGSPTLPSFVPLVYYGFMDNMNFLQRTINFVGMLYFELGNTFLYRPRVERLYREYLNNPDLPGIEEIQRNSSILLVNSHISLIPPRPMLPDIIEVGGMHLRPAQPLPKGLKEFFDGAGTDGVILFSMGTLLQGASMPERYRQIFVAAFARLTQRVLWKWETEEMADLPKNVKLTKWLPQQDVLGHKNLRVFITHGGHGGITEAIYAGVPIVGIPMIGDQIWNMELAEAKGFAFKLNFNTLSENVVYDAIQRVLTEPRYKAKAKELSDIYRNQETKPLDRAIFWIEHVVRHKGATYLRSASRNLNFFQYFSFDVIALLLTILVIIVAFTFILVRTILKILISLKSAYRSKKTANANASNQSPKAIKKDPTKNASNLNKKSQKKKQ